MTNWNLNVAMGEMIGSFILTLGILSITLVANRRAFSTTPSCTRRCFVAAGVFACVVIGITTAKGFGGHGAINPAISLMLAIYQGFGDFLVVVGFDFVGGILAAGTFIMFACIFNLYSKHEEQIMLKKLFLFNRQPVVQNVSLELFANVFWYLPVLGMVMLQNQAGMKQIGHFMVPLVAGFAIVVVLLIVPGFGVANLNPQVWLGEFIIKLFSHGKAITSQALGSELSGLVATLLIAAAFGGLGYALRN